MSKKSENVWCSMSISPMWRFPKMLVPPNHPYLKYTIWMIDMDDSYMDY
jgi:hypothetical protein